MISHDIKRTRPHTHSCEHFSSYRVFVFHKRSNRKIVYFTISAVDAVDATDLSNSNFVCRHTLTLNQTNGAPKINFGFFILFVFISFSSNQTAYMMHQMQSHTIKQNRELQMPYDTQSVGNFYFLHRTIDSVQVSHWHRLDAIAKLEKCDSKYTP